MLKIAIFGKGRIKYNYSYGMAYNVGKTVELGQRCLLKNLIEF